MRHRPSAFYLLKLSLLSWLLSPLGLSAQNLEVLGEYKIAFIGAQSNQARYQAAYVGARDAALELSRQYSIDLEVVELTPKANEDQVQALAQAFVIEADGIILSPSSGVNLIPSLEYAESMGQSIVFFEHGLNDWSPSFEILADEFEIGRLMGERLLRELPTQTRVAILHADPETPALSERLQGIRSALGYRRIEKVVTTAPDYASAIATIQATEAADKNDQISGWVFMEDWAMTGFPALPWQPGTKPTITLCTNPTTLLYLQQGYVQSLITQPYYDWGYQSLQKLAETLHLNQAPEPAQIISEAIVIGPNELKSQQENWKRWLQ